MATPNPMSCTWSPVCNVVKRRAMVPPKLSTSVTKASWPVWPCLKLEMLWNTRHNGHGDTSRDEDPLELWRREQHTGRHSDERHDERETRRDWDLWRRVRPEQQHEDDVLHQDHEVLTPRAHGVALEHIVDSARDVEQHFHVERGRREARDILGADDLEDLRQLEHERAGDDGIAEQLAHDELDTVGVGKVVVRKEGVEALRRDDAEEKLLFRGDGGHGDESEQQNECGTWRHDVGR